MSVPCGCARSVHEPLCAYARVLDLRRALFAGLYDDDADAVIPVVRRVAVLDPGYRGDDPACRRVALLAID